MIASLVGDLEHFRARVMADALSSATSAFWLHRARSFDAAAPRPGDFTGRATPADLEAARLRCAGVALACRSRASLSTVQTEITPEVWRSMREAAA
jgi:hypothetical protein